MEIKNAVIKLATISTEDGFLDAGITLDYGGAQQRFGGWALYLPGSFDLHELKSVAGHFIYRIMEIAGVTEWNDLHGKTIRALSDHSHIEKIGHIVKDDWFDPRKDFEGI